VPEGGGKCGEEGVRGINGGSELFHVYGGGCVGVRRGYVGVKGGVVFKPLADCLEGGADDVLGLCNEVGEVYGAGGTVGRRYEGGIMYGGGRWVECEIVFMTGEPVWLCVDGVGEDSVGVRGELGFKVGEWWSKSELEEVWEAMGRGEGEDGEE